MLVITTLTSPPHCIRVAMRENPVHFQVEYSFASARRSMYSRMIFLIVRKCYLDRYEFLSFTRVTRKRLAYQLYQIHTPMII